MGHQRFEMVGCGQALRQIQPTLKVEETVTYGRLPQASIMERWYGCPTCGILALPRSTHGLQVGLTAWQVTRFGVWRIEAMPRKVSLRIRYRKRSDLVLLLLLPWLALAVAGHLASTDQVASAADTWSVSSVTGPMREYYLTTATYNGASATTACASGYHMASIWEILDPSGLKYNTTLGHTTDDSGSGPPVARGWVRTGYTSNNENIIGRANCSSWTTTAGRGTTAILPNTWDVGWEDLLAWNTYTWECSTNERVWCVADRVGSWIFLPLVMRDFN